MILVWSPLCRSEVTLLFAPLAGLARVLAFGLLLGLAIGASAMVSSPAAAQRGVPLPSPRPESITPRLLSLDDADQLREVLRKARANGWSAALPLLPKIDNPLGVKIVRWLYLQQTNGGASFEEIANFIELNPHWPRQTRLIERAEETMPETTPAAFVIQWFGGGDPLTGDGKLRLAEAHMSMGKTTLGRVWLRRAWREGKLSRDGERRVLAKHRKLLDTDDHDARLDRLIWDGQTAAARRMLRLVSPNMRALAQARLKLRANAGGVDAAIAAVPKKLQNHPGLTFERIRWRRQRNRDMETWPLLLAAPSDPEGLGDPVRWWYERRIQAREALKAGQPETAYRFLRNHGLTRGHAFAESEWKAGWIALRYLNRADDAEAHFARMAEKVSRPISRGRALYWRGRAAEAAGRIEDAKGFYAQGSAYDTTFYGQLAAEKTGGARARVDLPGTTVVDKDARTAFRSGELPQAVLIASDFASDYITRLFLLRLVEVYPTAEGHTLAARLALEIDMPHMAVRIGKLASYAGHPSTDFAYPVFDLPQYKGKGEEPEPALTHAIIRQESEFNPRAVSGAKARGLMQILPSTARRTAARHRLGYRQAWLTNRPDYNTQVGRAYLGDLIKRYDGSYVMAAAAYNAGPSRVNRWVREFGDPRLPGTDAVDWVELIPFRETRNYVQRVMENTQVYRARLINAPHRVSLALDLKRGPYGFSRDTTGLAEAEWPARPEPEVAAAPAVRGDSRPIEPSNIAPDIEPPLPPDDPGALETGEDAPVLDPPPQPIARMDVDLQDTAFDASDPAAPLIEEPVAGGAEPGSQEISSQPDAKGVVMPIFKLRDPHVVRPRVVRRSPLTARPTPRPAGVGNSTLE